MAMIFYAADMVNKIIGGVLVQGARQHANQKPTTCVATFVHAMESL